MLRRQGSRRSAPSILSPRLPCDRGGEQVVSRERSSTETASRIVVVTGGGSGIGKGIAKAFARDSSVTIVGRRIDLLRATAEELGPNVTWEPADVGKREQIAAAISNVVRRHQKIDVLVNNAGFTRVITTRTPLEEAEQLWDEVLTSVLKGSFLTTQAVVPYMARPGGRIVFVSSIAAYTGGSRPGAIAYAAAKAGLHGMLYSLARELSAEGITVNGIAPGFIANTGFTQHWSPERVNGIIAQVPVGRAGTADDVAAAARFLASTKASYISGEILHVNGGWSFGH